MGSAAGAGAGTAPADGLRRNAGPLAADGPAAVERARPSEDSMGVEPESVRPG